ncbi:hypothetical protein ACFQ0G_42810 [Streptomyces chiangmaiensis]
MRDPSTALTDAGVSVWLDDLGRQRLRDHSLARLVADDHVAGVPRTPPSSPKRSPAATPTTLSCGT